VDSTPLTSSNLLTGLLADVQIGTTTEGNSIAGSFSLNFLGDVTRSIAHDATAAELKLALEEDISSLTHVYVNRTDPTNNCNDGFCPDGPTKQGGYTWTLELTTDVGNVSPTSPTSPDFDTEGAVEALTFTNELVDSYCTNFAVDSNCPTVRITEGHSRSRVIAMQELASTRPFSLAYGGGGAGYGGAGGQGYGYTSPGAAYNDDQISSLLGGSGGQLGYVAPYEANLFRTNPGDIVNGRPQGRGGAGGGAIEIVAANDIVLGEHAIINLEGEKGTDAMMTGGGGGSGGALLLSAGGIIRHQGKISARGGAGGAIHAADLAGQERTDIVSGHGAAGSGGRVAMFAQAIT
jgi:hypothetical protein